MSPTQVAMDRNINERTVRKAIQLGLLKAAKIPTAGEGRWRINFVDYQDWVMRGAPTSVRPADDATEG